jgi:hypothetical protein
MPNDQWFRVTIPYKSLKESPSIVPSNPGPLTVEKWKGILQAHKDTKSIPDLSEFIVGSQYMLWAPSQKDIPKLIALFKKALTKELRKLESEYKQEKANITAAFANLGSPFVVKEKGNSLWDSGLDLLS